MLTIGIVSITRLCNQKLTEKKHLTIEKKVFETVYELGCFYELGFFYKLGSFLMCYVILTFLCIVVVYPGFIICELKVLFDECVTLFRHCF